MASVHRTDDGWRRSSDRRRSARSARFVRRARCLRFAATPTSVAASAGLVALAVLGCTVTEENYDLLSFFFDGVPDPRLVREGADAVALAKERGGVFFTHAPYGEARCGECHTDLTGNAITDVPQTVCLKCHAGVPEEYPLMHGPVAAGACLLCHAPHESTIPALLRTAAPAVCTQCHGAGFVESPASSVHADMTRDCLECHGGHGGRSRYFLDNWSGSGSATGAAEPPPAPAG